MASVELAVLGRILMLQSALHAAPDNRRLGELVCYALSDIPGVSSTAIYIDDRLVSQAASSPDQLTKWPSRWQDAQQSFSSELNGLVSLPLQTNKTNYGFLTLRLVNQQSFQGYLPHLENTVNLIALMLENRQQATELQKLNINLEAKVKDRVKSLQRSEKRLSLALIGAKSGIWDWNLKTGKFFFGPNYFKMAGYDPDEFPHAYAEWKVRVHPDDIERVESQIEDYLSGRTEQFAVEFRFKTKQGQWIWVLGQGIISERDVTGAPVRFTGTHTDINERKCAEEALANQQGLLEKSQELGHIGTWELDILNNTLIWTDENCRIFGVPLDSPVDYELFLEKVHPKDRNEVDQKWQAALEGKLYDIVHRLLIDNKTTWVRQKADIHFDENGQAISAIGFTQDITERKLVENALRESEERFRLVFETNPDPVIIARLKDGAFLDVNKAFELSTGILRHQALGHTSMELGLWANKDEQEPFRGQLKRDGEVNHIEADFMIRTGEKRTGLLSTRLLKLNSQRCILIVIRDITTEKAAERTLVEMNQMKNEFISTAAHELSTPLSAMMGFTEFLLDPEGFGGFSEEQRQDFLNEVYDRGEALSRIIDELLDISRIESGQPTNLTLQETNIGEVLTKAVEAFRVHNTGHLFRLDLPKDSEKAILQIDIYRIIQVLENLLSNAVKYSPKGEEIVVTGKPSPEGWEARVEDHGIGMTPEQVERVFDKFYRADASNTAVSGLGLGMSISKQIVEAHGGSIRVESVKGKGSTVTFNLPTAH